MKVTREFLRRTAGNYLSPSSLWATSITQQTHGAGAVAGTAVDAGAWPQSMQALVATGVATGAVSNLQLYIEESNDGVGGWSTILGPTGISNPSFNYRIPFTRSKRYVRATVILTGTEPISFNYGVVLQAVPLSPIAADVTQVGIYLDIIDKGVDTLLSDLTLGTGQLALTPYVGSWRGPIDQADGSVRLEGALQRFSPASAAEGAVIKGWYLRSFVTPQALLGYETFLEPVALADQRDGLTIVPNVLIDPFGRWGFATAWNG